VNSLFFRLDLEGYIASFESHLARQKPIPLEGDTKLHYEMICELQNITYPPPPKVANVDTYLMHLSKQGVLRVQEIWELVKIIGYFKKLSKFPFEGRVGEWIGQITIPESIEPIVGWFDEKGNLKSEVDPRFEQIDSSLGRIKEQLQTQFRQLLSTKRIEPYLVDRQIHLLHAQETLLVRGGFNHVLKATVVGRSSSGFFYVLPESVEALKKKQSQLLDEKEAIIYEYCKKISAEFAKKIPFLKFINRAFDRLDAYHARIAFAKEKGWEFLLPSQNQNIQLSGFKHPALQDPKPLHVNFNKNVLLVTGVNAGGKTMLLKSILSAVLMSKYLLPMPINAAKSKIGHFKNIEAIIEDPQNVKNDISTFAGRMVQFSKLFHKKGSTLVGIDEVELGTDADEAASLFKVLIDFWMDRGMKLIITTHHKRLASLLATDERVELLAALYDEKAQRPTFEFLHGTIGKSYAFETAQRYGIPANLIAKAKSVYGEDKENLNELIQKNIDLELKMKHTLAKLEEQRQKIDKKSAYLLEKEQKLESEYKKRELQLEREYNDAIKAAKDALKATRTKEADKALNAAHLAKKRISKAVIKKTQTESLKPGDNIKYGRNKGVLKGIRKDKAIIECEGITMHVPLASIKKSTANVIAPPVKTKINLSRSHQGSVELDLHGLRSDEAIEKLDKFLSDSLINGFDEVLVYHGIGTGKLAYAVKTFLKSHPKVVSFSDAPPNLGGFGATVVRL
jgi:DNA mismatch repair protein MutS2